MKLLLMTFILISVLATSHGQSRYGPVDEKSGSCPPALPVQICSQACFSDSHCLGIGKCCPTNCGGFVCSKPVTMRQTDTREKPGSCPAVPKGRWVCSPTCSVDTDCRGTLKCCKNRCGALTCQKVDVEVVESPDIPIVPLPEDPYNVPRNPSNNVERNPYNVLRNPSDNVERNPYNNPYNVPRNPTNNVERNPYNVLRNPNDNVERNPYNNPYNFPRNPYEYSRYLNSYPYYFYNK
ncbi:unnamed protein product [Anthophora plagiata]